MKPSAPDSPSSPPDCSAFRSDPLDEAVLKLAAQAAFLQGFAERLAEPEPADEVLPPATADEEGDYGWRAGLQW